MFDDNISEDYTVLDVFTKDRIGLLHDLSRAISSYGLDIHVARIGTDADRVADAFYITTAEGTRLTDGAEYDALREVITDALDGPQRDAG